MWRIGLLLLAVLSLVACGRSRILVATPTTLGVSAKTAGPFGMELPEPNYPVALWVEESEHKLLAQDGASRRDLLRRLRRGGFNGVILEASQDNATLRDLFLDLRTEGFEVSLAVSLLRVPVDSSAVLQQVAELDPQHAVPTRRNWTTADRSHAFLSPADTAAQAQILDGFRALAALRPDRIILVDFGFADWNADYSDAARQSLERRARRNIRQWPDTVATPASAEDRLLREDWQRWRGEVLRDLLFALRGTVLSDDGTTTVRIAALVDAPWREHARSGLNWGMRSAVREVAIRGLPSGYEDTAAGHLLDDVYLGLWIPALTEADAREQGYEPWTAIIPSLRMGRQLLDRQARTWAVVPVPPDKDARALKDELTRIAPNAEGLVILSLSSVRAIGLPTE